MEARFPKDQLFERLKSNPKTHEVYIDSPMGLSDFGPTWNWIT